MILWRGLRKLDITRKKKTQHANERETDPMSQRSAARSGER